MPATTINSESSYLSKVISDLDFYRRFYTVRSDDERKTPVRFISPALSAYDKYRYVLLRDSHIRELTQQYWYRPDYVSYEEYKTTNYWAVLLYINDIPSIEEFTKSTIIVPELSALSFISVETERNRPDLEIVPIDVRDLANTTPLYNSKRPEVSINTSLKNEDTVNTDADVHYARDTYTLKSIDVLNRYVDLTYAPVLESVKLIVKGQGNYLYNKHYTMIKGNRNQYTRLTWDPRKLSGPGMMNIMREKVSFDVTYVKKDK